MKSPAASSPFPAPFTPRNVLALVTLAVCLLHLGVVTGTHTFFYRDYAIFGYPLAAFHRWMFWSGELPLWNAYNNLGLPFLAQWNTMVLYPLSFIYLLLPMPQALGWFCLLHLLIAALGMYQLALRWTHSRPGAALAALLFTFNGLTLSCLKWPNNIAALSLMPWVILTLQVAWRHGGRHLPIAVLLSGCQMLSGAPEIILFTWFIAGCLWLVEINPFSSPATFDHRPIFRLPIITLAVALLAAAQLLPFLELLQNSHRSPNLAEADWSMPAWGAANFLLPLFRTFPSHQDVYVQFDQYWVASYYPGLAALILGPLALLLRPNRTTCTLAVLTALAIWLAMGPAAGLFLYFQKILPGAGVMRFPIKFVVVTTFTLPLLAAFGLKHWLASIRLCRSQRRSPPSYLLLSLLGILLLALAAIITYGLLRPLAIDWPLQEQHMLLSRHGLSRAFWLLLTGGCLFGLAHSLSSRTRFGFLAALIFVALVDLCSQAIRLNPTVETWVYHQDNPEVDIVQVPVPAPTHFFRALLSPEAEKRLDHLVFTNALNDALYSRRSLFCNINLIDRIPKVDGFYSLYLKREYAFRQRLHQNSSLRELPVLNLMNVRYLTAPDAIIDWDPHPNPLPLLSAGQQPLFIPDTNALDAILQTNFNPSATVLLPAHLTNDLAAVAPGPVAITDFSWSPHRVSARVSAPAPAVLLHSQAHYPGWRATVDDDAVPIHLANYLFQAVILPPGDHRVTFAYHSKSFPLGAALSLGTLLLLAIAYLRALRQAKSQLNSD